DVTQTEIPKVQEQNSTSENSSISNNVGNSENGGLGTGGKAGIITACIVAAFIAITILVVHLRKRCPRKYQRPANFNPDNEGDEGV
ncbi:hypothetical protein BgiMline_030191, partial [Biomphalaria glabrata]